MKKHLIAALAVLMLLFGVVGFAACKEQSTHKAGSSWEHNELGHWHVCTECGIQMDFSKHTAGEVQTDGVEDWTQCTMCEYEMLRTVHAHSYGDWKAEVPATCSQPGTKGHYTCSSCKKNFDAEYKEIEDLTLTAAHSYGAWVEEVAAACTTDGTKGHYTCSSCKKNFDAEYKEIIDLRIPAAHSYGAWVEEAAAACTTDGTKGHYTCSSCKKNFDAEYKEIEDLRIPATHSYGAWVEEVAATCTKNGTKGHYTCLSCGKNFDAEYNVIDDFSVTASGHAYTEEWTWTKTAGEWGAVLTLTCSNQCNEEDNMITTDEVSVQKENDGSYTATASLAGEKRTGNYTPTPVKVIVMAGQSNMVGHSYSKYLTAPEQTAYESASFENVKIYLSVNPYSASPNMTDSFVPVTGGMGRIPDDKTLSAFGPEYGLAAYLTKTYPGETFYIIKDATGGTTLYDRWYSPSSAEYLGKEYAADTDNLYAHLIERVHGGMNLLLSTMDAEIVSFMWMQGESDANASAHPGDYLTLWKNFVGDLEKELADYLPDVGMSVIQGGITKYWTYYGDMNFAKWLYAEENSNAYYLDLADADWATVHRDNTDYAHYDAATMMRFGEEMGKLFSKALAEMTSAPVYTPYIFPLEGNGTAASPYLLRNTQEFLLFSRLYSNGALDKDVCVKLIDSITIPGSASGKSYDKAPFVGVGNRTHQFGGTFDGNGKTITFYLSKAASYAGLFRSNTGIIRNLMAEGTVAGGTMNVGGIVGYNYGTIENCTNKVVLSVHSSITATNLYHYGGIAGSFGQSGNRPNSVIESCANSGIVNGTDSRVGGIAGMSYGAVVRGCTNSGSVYLNDAAATAVVGVSSGYLGQLVGYNTTAAYCFVEGGYYKGTEFTDTSASA